MNLLEGKVALVIGGGRGIGAAISRRLAAEGAAVAMSYRSRDQEAEVLRSGIEAAGAAVLTIRADVAEAGEVDRMFDAAIARFGRVDIVVVVPGVAALGPLEDLSDADFDLSFAVNVRAPFLAARRAAQVMETGGRILFIGTIVADRCPGRGASLYGSSKAALGGLTRALARELGERGITVNLVQPGPIDTERNPADGPNADRNRAPLAIPRHGRPEEVAALVAWLASAEAGFVTGSTYDIDGGWSA